MTVQDLLQTGNYTLIDVREPMELMMDGSIDGAVNIPLGQLPQKLDEIKEMKGTKIIFCRSGGRAGNAVQFLAQNGIEDSYNGGGYMMMYHFLQDLKR